MSSAEPPAERIIENEIAMRRVNEAIGRGLLEVGPDGIEFRCECGRPDCSARVTLDVAEYEDVRERFAHFIVALGHATSIDHVLAPKGDGEVVAKVGAGADAAEASDPRSESGRTNGA